MAHLNDSGSLNWSSEEKNVKICSRHAFRMTEIVSNTRVLCPPFGSVVTIRGEAMMSMARDGDRVCVTATKKKMFHSTRAAAFGIWPPGCRVVFVLSEIFPVSVTRNSSIQRSVKRLATVHPYVHKFACGSLLLLSLRKPHNRTTVCTIKHLITRIYGGKKLLFINLLRFLYFSHKLFVSCEMQNKVNNILYMCVDYIIER